MKRHAIWGRFSEKDIAPKISRKEQLTPITLNLGEFSLRSEESFNDIFLVMDSLKKEGLIPSPIGIDLAILAVLINAADTRISRETESEDGWTREIDLYVPVSNVKKWNATKELVCKMLKFLTGDIWRVKFLKRPKLKHNELSLTVKKPFTSVSLFSGGLDSYIGAIDLLERKESSLFISHDSWGLSTSRRHILKSRIEKKYGKENFSFIRARVGFNKGTVKDGGDENTLRARSFLFFALATLAASSSDKIKTIYVPENGLISLNVPLDPLRLGALSTKTTHPFYMAKWNELLKNLDIQISLQNLYRFKTKGEMVEECQNQDFLKKTYKDTISCSSSTKILWLAKKKGYIKEGRHCGYCVPCLIRRAAIIHAYKKDRTIYYPVTYLSKGNALNSTKTRGIHVRSFQYLKSSLSKSDNRYKIQVHGAGPLSDYSQGEINEYVEVFRRGVDEVYDIIKNVTVKPI